MMGHPATESPDAAPQPEQALDGGVPADGDAPIDPAPDAPEEDENDREGQIDAGANTQEEQTFYDSFPAQTLLTSLVTIQELHYLTIGGNEGRLRATLINQHGNTVVTTTPAEPRLTPDGLIKAVAAMAERFA